MFPCHPVHYYPANYYYQHTGKNYEAGIGKKLKPGNIEPSVGAKRRVDIYKYKGKEGSEKYQLYNILLIIKIGRYRFLKVKHGAPDYYM